MGDTDFGVELTVERLLRPTRVYTRSEVLNLNCPVPREPGIYAWYFDCLPATVPEQGCHVASSMRFLYTGIAPKAPPQNGKPASRQSLRTRIRYHYRGNAEGSTLRLTLGCLLADQLRLRLRKVGSGNRLTFGEGEQTLSSWMEQHAFVAWQSHPQPWEVEHQLIRRVALPLNLDMNRTHPFHAYLSGLRKSLKTAARLG